MTTALSKVENGVIPIDMSRIPTDRTPTISELFRAIGGELAEEQ